VDMIGIQDENVMLNSIIVILFQIKRIWHYSRIHTLFIVYIIMVVIMNYWWKSENQDNSTSGFDLRYQISNIFMWSIENHFTRSYTCIHIGYHNKQSYINKSNLINNTQNANNTGMIYYVHHNIQMNECSFINRFAKNISLLVSKAPFSTFIMIDCYFDDKASSNPGSCTLVNKLATLFTKWLLHICICWDPSTININNPTKFQLFLIDKLYSLD
jgi:hypothetical protein